MSPIYPVRSPLAEATTDRPDWVVSVGRATEPGEKPRRPTDHMATTASRSFSAAPFVAGAASGASATACASLAYSFFERPESISSEATTTSVFQCRLPASSSH